MAKETYFDAKWADMNGRKHRLYSVRSAGRDAGFMVVDLYHNTVVNSGFATRAEAWDWMRETPRQ